MNAGPLEFRPMQGCIAVAERFARALGLSAWWDGPEGLKSVAEQKLKEMGVPQKPIPLEGNGSISPRQLAEHAGFIKRRRRLK